MSPGVSSSAPIHLLVIDDDEEDFEIFSDLINQIHDQHFNIEWCSDFAKGSRALRHGTHDIYFIDYHLGAKTGVDLIKEAMANGCTKPTILLTGQGNEKVDKEAMHAGAVDYLVKANLSSEQLDRCIRYVIEGDRMIRELRTSEKKFRSLFERSKEVIFIADNKLNIENINQAASDLFGYAPNEWRQLNLSQLMVNQSNLDQILKMLIEKEELSDYKIQLFTKEGMIRECIISASLEKEQTGTWYTQGIIHDVSMLKRVEEIRRQAEKLEARGMVIRTLAHEVRNPLQNIILSLGFLKSEVNGRDHELLNVIDRNSKRINDLINELMESHQYHKLSLQVTSLQTVMNEAIADAADRIRLKHVKLNVQYPTWEARALLDREKVKMAFLNIIVNAIEALDKQPGELTISISSHGENHVVQIKDNGCGMSAESVKRLFESYFTTKPTGMGLGLTTTNAILQSHKAEIKVTSVLGEGSTFTITFPSL